MARGIALVASEEILGLLGCIILVQPYGICPNILSWGVTEDPDLLVIDTLATSILIALAGFLASMIQ